MAEISPSLFNYYVNILLDAACFNHIDSNCLHWESNELNDFSVELPNCGQGLKILEYSKEYYVDTDMFVLWYN